jgi:two-component system sensor kinase FixL
MRNFVRPASGQLAPVEVNDLVREVCDLCRPQLEDADVRLSADLADVPTSIRADGLEIQQVLVNLIQNATQALSAVPRQQRNICIRTCADANDVQVTVIDSGPGFSSGCPEDSFAPFLSTKADGLGMGLAISRTILDRYQGRIWGDNRLEGGAVVGFRIPYSGTNDSSSTSETHCLCR